jgi:propanol-preferring alcohol dehydrogenase
MLEEVPKPVASSGEVLIRIAAAGICRTDLHFLSGLLNLGVSPLTLGHEIAGTIEEVGPGVDKALIGKRVIAYYYTGCQNCEYCRRGMENLCANLKGENGFITDGGYAEYIKVSTRNAVPLPDNISFQTAAPIGCSLTTAVHASRLARLTRGESVVVYGVGGVGYSLVQMARLHGATVIAVGRTPAKLAKARELGAHHTIDAREQNVAAEVRKITNGKGADVIFELVGVLESMDNSVRSLAKQSRIVFIGYSQDSFSVHPIQLVINEAEVIGSVGNTLGELYEAVSLVESGKIQIVIDRTVTMDRFDDGLKALSDGKPVGKIVLLP